MKWLNLNEPFSHNCLNKRNRERKEKFKKKMRNQLWNPSDMMRMFYPSWFSGICNSNLPHLAITACTSQFLSLSHAHTLCQFWLLLLLLSIFLSTFLWTSLIKRERKQIVCVLFIIYYSLTYEHIFPSSSSFVSSVKYIYGLIWLENGPLISTLLEKFVIIIRLLSFVLWTRIVFSFSVSLSTNLCLEMCVYFFIIRLS